MNKTIDQLAEEMTELCQQRIKAHWDDPAFSDYIRMVWKSAQNKVSMLPWNDIQKFSTTAVTTFVVISSLSGDGWVEGWTHAWWKCDI